MTTRNRASLRNFVKNSRAISPAISTVILASAVIVLLLVTIVFANNFLDLRMAENEFSAMEQFMQTVGLQMDDVAWTIGRTQTIRYATRYGQLNFEPLSLGYTVYVNTGGGYVYLTNYTVGALMFNMPVSKYTLGNNYYERIFPSDGSFVQNGASASVYHVYIIQKMPVKNENFIRVVVIPTIRMLNSTISDSGGTTNYYKLYLPVLSSGTEPRYSQSVTLTGNSVSVKTEGDVTSIRIVTSYPKVSSGFDVGFFNFDNDVEEVDIPNGSVIEFYTGEVTVSLGLY